MRGWKGGLRKDVAGDKQKAGSAFHCIPAFLISLLSVGFLLFCGKEFFGQFFHLQEVGFLHAAFNRDHVFHDFHVLHLYFMANHRRLDIRYRSAAPGGFPMRMYLGNKHFRQGFRNTFTGHKF